MIQQKIYHIEDLHFIIADNDADFEYFTGKNYSYTVFSVAKLRRYFSWENIRDGFRFVFNIFRACWFLYRHRPEKIFSKGGFVSLPFGIAAWIFRIPFFMHETDSVMGLSNRILERFSTTVFTGFPSSSPRHIFVGNPVRKEFFQEPKAIVSSPLKILVFGGSQGAKALNEWTRWFFGNQKKIAEVFLVTGKGKKSNNEIDGLREVEFLHDDFISAVWDADIVIARAGGSVAELAAAQKCVVLVPLPSAANDHQRKNAEFFAKNNAALVVQESQLYEENTTKTLLNLFSSSEQQKQLSHHLSSFAKKDTVETIVKTITHS